MRDTSAPSTLKARTLCFCPCNTHPLAIMGEGASFALHSDAPLSAGFFHGEALDRSLRASETCMNKEDIILNMRVFSRGVMFLFEYPLCYVENGL